MSSRTPTLVFLSVLILTLSITSPLGSFPRSPTVHAASLMITLRGGFATGWNGTNPGPTSSMTQGDGVTINLVSADGVPHMFVIDTAHSGITPSPNCAADKCSSRFSSSTTFSFTADMTAGTYTYYCSIHLQKMYGSFVIQSGSSPSSNPGSPVPKSTSVQAGQMGLGAMAVVALLIGVLAVVLAMGIAVWAARGLRRGTRL